MNREQKFGRLAAVFAAAVWLVWAGAALALDVGEPAPEFNLMASTGDEIALSDFRGQMLLIEFYHADFGPT